MKRALILHASFCHGNGGHLVHSPYTDFLIVHQNGCCHGGCQAVAMLCHHNCANSHKELSGLEGRNSPLPKQGPPPPPPPPPPPHTHTKVVLVFTSHCFVFVFSTILIRQVKLGLKHSDKKSDDKKQQKLNSN